MARAPLPIEVEEFLSWMVAEKGRSANTLAAYRRDLSAYCEWLRAHERSVLDVSHTDLVDIRRRTPCKRCGDIVDGPPTRSDSDAAPVSVDRGGAHRRSHRGSRGGPCAGGIAQAPHGGRSGQPARCRDRERSRRPSGPGAAGAAVRHRGADLRSGGTVDRRHRPRRSVSSVSTARVPRSGSCPSAERRYGPWTPGSPHRVGPGSCRSAGSGVGMPRRSS